MNIPTECDAVWITVATHMIVAPRMTAARRPSPSDTYGENGYAATEPMFCEGHAISCLEYSSWQGDTNLDRTQESKLSGELAKREGSQVRDELFRLLGSRRLGSIAVMTGDRLCSLLER